MALDIYYKEFTFLYRPHPKLYGKFEVWKLNEGTIPDYFLGRYESIDECKKAVDKSVKHLQTVYKG